MDKKIEEILKIKWKEYLNGDYDSGEFFDVSGTTDQLLSLIREYVEEVITKAKPKTYIVDGKEYHHALGGLLALDQYEANLRAKLKK